MYFHAPKTGEVLLKINFLLVLILNDILKEKLTKKSVYIYIIYIQSCVEVELFIPLYS